MQYKNKSKGIAHAAPSDAAAACRFGSCVYSNHYFNRKRAVQSVLDAGISNGGGFWRDSGGTVLPEGK